MMYVPLTFLSEWREFPSASCLSEKKNLMTARVSMSLKWRTSPNILPFSLCNKKRLATQHTDRPLLRTTQSIPSYDIGKEVGIKTYQHPLICLDVYQNFFADSFQIRSLQLCQHHLPFSSFATNTNLFLLPS